MLSHEHSKPRQAPGPSVKERKLKVVIAHRNPVVCAGLEAALAAQGDFEIVASHPDYDWTQGRDAAIDSVPLVVADCATGLQLAAREQGIRILIVTHDDRELSIRRAVELGIRGYLLLTASLEAVAHALRCVHDGGVAIEPAMAANLVSIVSGPALTRRELEVLRLVMRGCSDKAIANRLGTTVGTVKCHVKSILSKLNVSSRTEAAAVSYRRGLVPEEAGLGETEPGPSEPRRPPVPGAVVVLERPNATIRALNHRRWSTSKHLARGLKAAGGR
ncbi:MAG: DNA-binding response regulator [Gammaproteobacteria bacterium]|nr:DNA-binding response regulator [Gammaproteobacteria bacterium]